MLNPDLWHPYRGGEKPMDLAYLTAVTRSTTLPPYDPWFAGGYINYYYLGQFFTATLLEADDDPAGGRLQPRRADLLRADRRRRVLASPTTSRRRRGVCCAAAPACGRLPRWSLYAAGLLGAFFVALAGNLDGVDQLSDRLAAVSTWHVDTPAAAASTAVVNSVGGLWQVVVPRRRAAAVRLLALQPHDAADDQHHGVPLLQLPLRRPARPHDGDPLRRCWRSASASRWSSGGAASARRWREWALVALLGLVVGSLRWLNSWDYPPFLLLALAGVLISERRLEGGAEVAIPRGFAKALVVVGLSFLRRDRARHRQDRRGRRHQGAQDGIGPGDGTARGHGCAADRGGDRRGLCLQDARQDARLRP